MSRWRVVTTLPEGVWRERLDAWEEATIFHTPEMQEVFARVPGHTPLLWAAVDDRGIPAALFTPVIVTLKGGLWRPLTSRAVAYGGVLAERSERGLDALAAVLRAHNAAVRSPLFTELRHMHDPTAWQPALTAAGYRWEPHLNFLLPMEEGEEGLWRRMNRTARKNVRKAEREGVQVRPVQEREEVRVCYGFLEEVYARARVPLAPPELFLAVFDVLVPRGMAYFWLAYHRGRPIATRVTLAYRGRLVDWYGGATASARHVRPDDFLVWHVLRWGVRAGYKVFDFGGAGHPDSHHGIRAFKAKFGGDRVNYGRSTYLHHPLLFHAAQGAYALWRKLKLLLSRSPSFRP